MTLNVKKMKSAPSKSRVAQDELAIDSYMTRIAQVIDLGIQPREKWCTTTNSYIVDTEKAPAQKVMVTYEFLTEFCKDAEGNFDETKPRWLSEELFLFPLDVDLATSTKRYKALDPQEKVEGDWTLLVGAPCTVTIAHKKSGKAKIGTVTPAMKGVPYPELKNDPKVFTIAEPNLEVYGSLPDWVKDKITSSVGFSGSALDVVLNGGAPKEAPKPQEAPKQAPTPSESSDDEDGDDTPW